jgi:hypothetical protein
MTDTSSSSFEVKRQLPRRSLRLSVVGGLVAVVIIAYDVRYGFGFLSPGFEILAALLLLMMLAHWPTLGYYAFAARRLAFGEHGMVYGDTTYPYAEMASIGSYVSKEATKIQMADGKKLLLRWDVWMNAEIWEKILEARTFPHLYREACGALTRGEKVSFGRGASLEQRTLILPKGKVAIDTISAIRFVNENNMGAQSRILHVEGGNQDLPVNEDRLYNQHVLLALLTQANPADSSHSMAEDKRA